MDKNTFITLQSEDIKTLNNPAYNAILEGFKEYIPAGSEIAKDKSIEGFYKFMEAHARKNQKNGFYCIDPFNEFKDLMFKYLDIKPVVNNEKDIDISLEDFFS